MDDLEPDFEVAPYTLDTLIHKAGDVQIWTVKGKPGRVLKLRDRALMAPELARVLEFRYRHSLPKALWNFEGEEAWGVQGQTAWIAVRYYPWTLDTVPHNVLLSQGRRYMRQILDDLESMGEWLHCDIKPSNIMMDENEAALIDFELSTSRQEALRGTRWEAFMKEYRSYYHWLGALDDVPHGPRWELEALGIAFGFRMADRDQSLLRDDVQVPERDWDTLASLLHEAVLPYMTFLQTKPHDWVPVGRDWNKLRDFLK